MDDLLPPEAARRRTLTRKLLHCFELNGYELVTPPAFEHADVVERSNDSLDERELLRFVEPESGQVAVLPPDITPQIARITATRLADRPPPFRLCYQGRIIRRRRGRARSHGQLTQAGVECIGIPGADGDTEILELARRACEHAGMRDFRIELSQVTLAASLLNGVEPGARANVYETLKQKDPAQLARVIADANLDAETGKRLAALVEHYGDTDVLDSAEREFTWDAARLALANLREIVSRLEDLGLSDRVGIDLSDVRGLSYYTGMSFSILAPGPGEAVGGGGRYDSLLERFGSSAPATGFAIDVGNLQWTLRAAGTAIANGDMPRVALAGDPGTCRALAAALRRSDVAVATLPAHTDHVAFARAWAYDAAVMADPDAVRLTRLETGQEHRFTSTNPEPILRLLLEGKAT